jgi:hypothetical protein
LVLDVLWWGVGVFGKSFIVLEHSPALSAVTVKYKLGNQPRRRTLRCG